MAFRITKGTLGTQSDGVIVAKTTYYPQQGTALADAAGVGTETAPTVYGSSQIIQTRVSFSNPSGAASTWDIPAPQGRWRVIDCLIRKVGAGTGGAADEVSIKSVKAGTASGGLFGSAAAGTTMSLNTIAAGTLVRAAQRNDTSNSCLLDSSVGDYLQVALAKGTTTAQCDLFLTFVLEG